MRNGKPLPAWVQLAAIAIASAALLGAGIENAGIASAFSDPVGKIRAQDESSYASSAVHLAVEGGWLTPKVLGRYFLFKPPLLVWLSGLCLKLFGISLWALRLPALVAGILATAAVFWWAGREQPAAIAWSAVLLLLSNPLWHIFARLCYTDMLWAASTTGALAFLYSDPALSGRRAFWGFAVLTAASVMAKNVAGVLPVLVLLLYCLLAPAEKRPSRARVALAGATAAALIAPWHLYQIMVHPKWFWADYVQVQLGYGVRPPGQISEEGHFWFYIRRLVSIDPLILLLMVLALPSLARTVRSRNSSLASLLAAWLAVSAAALAIFRFHNLPYSLSIVAPCALVAAIYGPFSDGRRAPLGAAVLCLALVAKSFFPGQVWGLSFGRAEPLPAAAALRSYINLGRANDLILVDPDDDLYATTLPLPSVRYYFFDPDQMIPKMIPHYSYLGITISLEDFEHLDALRPVYAARLRDWGLDSTEPLATAIRSASPDGVLRLIRARPQADFYLPDRELPAVALFTTATHRRVLLPNGRAFLLALHPGGRLHPMKWTLPERW